MSRVILIAAVSAALSGCGSGQRVDGVGIKMLIRADAGDLHAEVECRGTVSQPECFFSGDANGTVSVEAFVDIPVVGKLGVIGVFDSEDHEGNTLCAQYLGGTTCTRE